MNSVACLEPVDPGLRLSAPALRLCLERYARRKLSEHDAEDVVQATLADALCARIPDSDEGLRQVVFGILRHKLADHYRRRERELLGEHAEPVADCPPFGERDLLRWAFRALPAERDASSTLEWMLREGDGEKLEQIADSERLPAPCVRKRVSRLRSYFRERWLRELSVAGCLAALLLGAVAAWRHGVRLTRESLPEIARELPAAHRRPLPPPGAIWRADVVGAVGSGLDHFLRYAALEQAFDSRAEPRGFRVAGLSLPSWWQRVDLRAGDVILSVNGQSLASRSALSQALAALPRADQLTLEYERAGVRKLLSYRIVDGPAP